MSIGLGFMKTTWWTPVHSGLWMLVVSVKLQPQEVLWANTVYQQNKRCWQQECLVTSLHYNDAIMLPLHGNCTACTVAVIDIMYQECFIQNWREPKFSTMFGCSFWVLPAQQILELLVISMFLPITLAIILLLHLQSVLSLIEKPSWHHCLISREKLAFQFSG